METDEQRQAKHAKRTENYEKRKASHTNRQTLAKWAKERGNYRKRKASETDEQRRAKIVKQRENYQTRKASMQTLPVHEQATCDSNKCDRRSSTSLSINVSHTNRQTLAKWAKERGNYRKRKASETDEQRRAKLVKQRENYQTRKASMQTLPVH